MESEFKFSPATRTRLHKEYGYICSVCLTAQTSTGSQCAHTVPRASYGQDMVNEAMSLGMLEPGSKYDRDSFENGTIQCATCHLGYFTGGFLVFSPPLPVLEWIIQQLDSLKPSNADSVWKIFRSLEEENGPDCTRFHHLYSLIPRFQAGDNAPAAECRSGARKAGTIRLFPPGTEDKDPVNNYWRLPVPCHVILFVFIDAILHFKFNYLVPEVAKALKIDRRLRVIRDENNRDENGRLRHSWNGGRRHLHEPRAPPSSPARTLKHKSCRHPMKDNSFKYCAQCWTLSPSNFPPIDTLPTDVSGSDDITSSHTICTAPGRPSIPAISHESAKAYPTPSSLPPPERESESAVDYFAGTSSRTSPPSAAFFAAAFDTPTPGPRSFRLRTPPAQSSLASISFTNSSSRPDFVFKSISTTFADSDEDPDYLPEESGGSDDAEDGDFLSETDPNDLPEGREASDTTEEDSDDAQEDDDSLSEALSQEGSEDGWE
ncbi:hypothetical protein MVEN_00451500 [Mycena venus]|uniref:Uncharacterized protein n=1 Tax=Mycena venus TaxID=2733690 RepID=A0A8H6YRA4_9AGAR|nr:hypothetical protein MVEN_00451500 [Mycena venus]